MSTSKVDPAKNSSPAAAHPAASSVDKQLQNIGKAFTNALIASVKSQVASSSTSPDAGAGKMRMSIAAPGYKSKA